MKKLAAMIALALTTAIAVPAMAQRSGAKATPAKAATTKTTKAKVQNMTFDPLEMQGTIGGPDGLMGTAPGSEKFEGFKLVRTTFYDKLVKSTERFE